VPVGDAPKCLFIERVGSTDLYQHNQ